MISIDYTYAAGFILLIWAIINVLARASKSTKLAGESKLITDEEIVYVKIGDYEYPVQKQNLAKFNEFTYAHKLQLIKSIEKKLRKGEIKEEVVEGRKRYTLTEKGRQIAYHKDGFWNDKKYLKQ